MYNYQQIDALFGAPLNTVPKPQVPFKLKTWHVVGGIVLISLCAYGAYAFHRDYIQKEGTRIKDKKDD